MYVYLQTTNYQTMYIQELHESIQEYCCYSSKDMKPIPQV